MKTWIVVANRSEAKIFSSDPKKNRDVEFVMKLENPRGRLRARDINADKPGFFAGSGSSIHGSSLVSPQSPTERVAQEFSKEIATSLDAARMRNDFEELILIADPHFLGLLREDLSKELRKMVIREEPRDLRAATGEDLQERLWPQMNQNVEFY